MNRAILDEGGTVMQFVGDAVMACFGAPVPLDDHADRAVCAARAMLERQVELNERWLAASRPPFGIGIGVSTGSVAAALLGSEERVEYTLVGDTVNLAQRLQDLARPSGRIVVNESTYAALHTDFDGRPTRGDHRQGQELAGAGLPHRRDRTHGTWKGQAMTAAETDGPSDAVPVHHSSSKRTVCARRSSRRAHRYERCGESTSAWRLPHSLR